jgi:hypothetical protein
MILLRGVMTPEYAGVMTPVRASKYVTCICGKVCKGQAAFVNHSRKCPQEQARSAAFVAAIEAGDYA